jgi:hypothetical protein
MSRELGFIENSIIDLERNLKANFEQYDLPLEHFFLPGVYVRALHIPCGVVLTGKIHNHECINIVAKGRLAVASVEGEKILVAGDIFKSEPGVKRAGFALEDTLYVTIHRTDTVVIDELEDELVSESYDDYKNRLEHLQ